MSLYIAAIIPLVIVNVLFLIYRAHLPSRKKWEAIIFGITLCVLFSPICIAVGRFVTSEVLEYVNPKPLHPTYAQLKKHGFYIFTLPEQEMYKRNWQQDIALWSWKIHCGVLTGDTYNPLVVTYKDQDENQVFVIQHGPWSIIWDRSKAIVKEKVPWESQWNNTGEILYYTNSERSNMWRHLYDFSDMQDQRVQIVSSLPVTETLELIKALEYIGPPVETLNNPWNCR